MALPTVTKTYDYTRTNVLWTDGGSSWGTHRRLWRYIKDTLIAWGWEVRGSCGYISGGLQYGMDGVDRWSSDGNLKWSDYYDNCTWIVLRKPNAAGSGKHFELMIQTTNGGYQAPWQLSVFCSFSPFVGGTGAWNNPPKPSGFSIPNNTWNFYGTSYSGWYYGDTALNIGDEGWGGYVHAICSTDNEVQRIIVCRNNAVALYIAFEKINTLVSTWTHPFVFTWLRYPTTYGYLYEGGTYTTAYDESGGTPRWTNAAMTTESYVDGGVGERIATKSDLSSERLLTPVGLMLLNAPKRGYVGRYYDLWFTSSYAKIGDTFPSDGSMQFATFNNLVIPWGVAAPPAVVAGG